MELIKKVSIESIKHFVSRDAMYIHFPSTVDNELLMKIYRSEDALSEITIISNESKETFVHLDYVIPLSLSFLAYGEKEEIEQWGTHRWIMEIAKLNDVDKQFRNSISKLSKDVSFMSLDEYRQYKIKLSKTKLAEFLENNPLISACRGTYAAYNATEAKQNQFAAQFSLYLTNISNGIEDIMLWNESGKDCEEWSTGQCIMFMNDMKAYTMPLVSAQQKYELSLYDITDKTELENADIDFSLIPTTNGSIKFIGKTIKEVKEMIESKS